MGLLHNAPIQPVRAREKTMEKAHKRRVHTVVLTFEVSTLKTSEEVVSYIRETADDIEGMLEQGVKDCCTLDSLTVTSDSD
jgi:hypothetical protein